MFQLIRSGRKRSGFTLIELLVVVAIIALLIGILLPALGEAKRQGRYAGALSNLHQFAVATGTYSADYQDRIWAFTWRASSNLPTQFPDLKVAPTDNEAAVCQAVDILRRRADRLDFPRPSSWIPHVLYTHLVLQDYLAQRLPEKMVVDPADKHRLNWQIDPVQNFDQGLWLPFQPQPIDINKRWPYSTSWQIVPAAYDRSPVGARINQHGINEYTYYVPTNGVLGGAKLGDVEFFNLKVMLHDDEQRHFTKRNLYYSDPILSSRVVVGMFDGSSRAVLTSECNRGWQPNLPQSPNPTVMNYTPDSWPWRAPSSTGFAVLVEGYYRWTRGGLKGVDFGTQEIDTGQY
jgi:prepilin-type N-terminal cleavage/methylation domain-containing protein